MKGSDLRINTSDERMLAYIAVGLLIFGYAYHQQIGGFIEGMYSSYKYNYVDTGNIYFTKEQTTIITSSYTPSRQHEVGWCIKLMGDRVVQLIVGDTYASGRDFTLFSCPPGSSGTLHYHLSGIAIPSGADEKSFLSSDEKVMCIFGGRLNCFGKGEDGLIKPVAVYVG